MYPTSYSDLAKHRPQVMRRGGRPMLLVMASSDFPAFRARVRSETRALAPIDSTAPRSCEIGRAHLQSRFDLICRLLLEKKNEAEKIQRVCNSGRSGLMAGQEHIQ